MNEKSLDELYEYRDKLYELLEYARLYRGNINLGSKLVSIEELREELKNVKSEIASRISNVKLRKIK